MKRRLIKWLLRQRRVQLWLAYSARPAKSHDEVKWTRDDAQALEGFLGTGTGRKLLLELENLKADADTGAILRCKPENAYGSATFARGIRAAVAKLKTLSVVPPQEDTIEEEQVSLPADLAHLSDT